MMSETRDLMVKMSRADLLIASRCCNIASELIRRVPGVGASADLPRLAHYSFPASADVVGDLCSSMSLARPLRLWLYRVTENDQDGDPMDHGIVAAWDDAGAVKLLRDRLVAIGYSEDGVVNVTVRLYPAEWRDEPGVFSDAGGLVEHTFNEDGSTTREEL